MQRKELLKVWRIGPSSSVPQSVFDGKRLLCYLPGLLDPSQIHNC